MAGQHGRPDAQRYANAIRCGSSCACRSNFAAVRPNWSESKCKEAAANWCRWPSWATGRHSRVDQMIYHKNLHRVAYVFAETAGRPPADVVVDVMADRVAADARGGEGETGRRGDAANRHVPPRLPVSPSPPLPLLLPLVPSHPAPSSTTAAALPGQSPPGFTRRSGRAKANGRSRSTCSATSAWPSARR